MKKILTIIIDGFGLRNETNGNAIKEADMRFFNQLWDEYPHSSLYASDEFVGLEKGIPGNCEAGHISIGAGRTIKQNSVLVNEFLKSNLSENEKFQKLVSNKDKTIHLMGLLSDTSNQADINNIISMYKVLVKNGCNNINFHIITDGRNTGIHDANKFIKMVTDVIKEYKVGRIATICGRYYAMDRNQNYDRTKKYYDLVTSGIGINNNNIKDVINKLYEKNINDEQLLPILVDKDGLIKNGDILLWMNYRIDRSIQILSAFVDDNFNGFTPIKMPNLEVYTILPMPSNLPVINLIDKPVINNTLGRYLEKLELTQARIADSERMPYVTYFFDGEYDNKISRCNTFCIPLSDNDIENKPELEAIHITKKVVECMMQDYDFILVNYSNPDLLGHTGNYDATIKACLTIDVCLEKIIEKANENFYKVIILSDHGNAEYMLNEDNTPVTTHTLNKVPFIILDKNIKLKDTGDLTMVAPTILEYMDIAVPEEMKETEILLK